MTVVTRKHATLIAVAVGLAAMAAIPSASAEGKLEEVLARGKLIVGTGSTFAPWSFRDESGALVGFDVDIAKILAKGLFDDPEAVEFVVQGADARIPNVTTGKVDITCQYVTTTAARAQQVAFTIPHYREGVGLLVLKDSKYKSYDDIKAAGSAVTAGVLQNVFAEDTVHQALPEANVDQFESADLPFQALSAGRIDAVVSDVSSLGWQIAQNPDKYRDLGYGSYAQSYSCAVKRGDADWLQWVNTALHEAMTGVEFPTYRASFRKWFGANLPEPKVGFPAEMD